MPGLPELLVILLIVIVIFGAGRLPQLGEALGRGIKNFKKASKDDDSIQVTQKKPESLGASPEAEADAPIKSRAEGAIAKNDEAIEVAETVEKD